MCFNYVELGISHGNLKPANILQIDDYYNIKITDFGTSRILIENSMRDYLSPEMFYKHLSNDDKLEINLQKSDVFSVGLTILRLAGYSIVELN